MKNFLNKVSIINANKILLAIFLVSFILFLSSSIFIYQNSKKLLNQNTKIARQEHQLSIFFQNILLIENKLNRYLKQVPILTKGQIKEYHPSKLGISSKIKELKREIVMTNKDFKALSNYNKLSSHFLLLEQNLNLLIFKEENAGELNRKYDEINEHFFFLVSYAKEEMEKLQLNRRENLLSIQKNRKVILVLLITIALIILIFLTLSSFYTKLLTDKISYIKNKLHKMQLSGTLEQIRYNYNDEIKSLISLFNKVLKKNKVITVQLKETKDYLATIFNSSPGLIIVLDENAKITKINKHSFEFLNIWEKHVIGKKIFKIHPLFREIENNISKVLKFKMSITLNKRVKSSDFDKAKYFDVIMYPIIHNHKYGAVLYLFDRTKLQNLNSQLKQAQKMEIIGNIAGGLAHDFNNVLGGIEGTVSIVKFLMENNESLKREKISHYIETIDTSTQRAIGMVKQLLSLSRKREVSLKLINLSDSLKNIYQLAKNSFDKRVELNFNCPEEKTIAKADPIQIEQIFLNLCINAEHAMTIMRQDKEDYGGTLTVEINKKNTSPDQQIRYSVPEGEFWQISIKDTGIGMTDDQLSKIFEPFYSTKKQNTGTGLGLSVVYNIIEAHSGFIEVSSTPGSGSVFNVYIPAVTNISDYKKQIAHNKIFHGEGCVLIVDDEYIIRQIAKEILETAGYQTLLAENGREAIKIFKENQAGIDLILLDFAMPDLNGHDVLKKIRTLDVNQKVLMTSGYNQNKVLSNLVTGEDVFFIKKPFNITTLTKKVNKIIRGEQ